MDRRAGGYRDGGSASGYRLSCERVAVVSRHLFKWRAHTMEAAMNVGQYYMLSVDPRDGLCITDIHAALEVDELFLFLFAKPVFQTEFAWDAAALSRRERPVNFECVQVTYA